MRLRTTIKPHGKTATGIAIAPNNAPASRAGYELGGNRTATL